MANQILYGFANLRDVFSRNVTDVGIQLVADAIQQSLDEHNRQMNAMKALFTARVDPLKPSARYLSPSVARLQPSDENGRARPIRPSGYYNVAFPLQQGSGAWGTNYVAGQKMTVERANEFTAMLTEADLRWVRDHILAALFAPAAWTFADEEFGDLTIQPLALASDGVKYYIAAGADSNSTDTHLIFQAAAIADAANPFPTIYKELMEHPENSGEVIVFMPSNLMDSVRLLNDFFPVSDPNVALANTISSLRGNLGVAVPGELAGYANKCWIVEWRTLPDNFAIAITTQGDRPLGEREDPETSLQGFKQVADRNDYPWLERQYLRRVGFGARNRVGAVVIKFGAGSYAVPTGYESPMS